MIYLKQHSIMYLSNFFEESNIIPSSHMEVILPTSTFQSYVSDDWLSYGWIRPPLVDGTIIQLTEEGVDMITWYRL